MSRECPEGICLLLLFSILDMLELNDFFIQIKEKRERGSNDEKTCKRNNIYLF